MGKGRGWLFSFQIPTKICLPSVQSAELSGIGFVYYARVHSRYLQEDWIVRYLLDEELQLPVFESQFCCLLALWLLYVIVFFICEMVVYWVWY